MSTPRNPSSRETATTGRELVKYEPYLELVSRLWFAAAVNPNRLAEKIARTTRLSRSSSVIFVDEPVTWETLPQRLAERRRDYAGYFASLPPVEAAASRRGLLQRPTPEMEATVAEAAARVFARRQQPGPAQKSQRANDTHASEGEHR
ncbi:hypothetical protein SAMN05421776_11397 [Nocardia farcinica]|uniref:Uncharacterized protein n=1 Tax=Nocardia farcinica TaxID=37329 RepID=A0A0H5PBB0_NOCFR|nr:hypothetical protein [Nocardia farcinica]AXK89994.1 hypothetical protein DXT66_29845 [Nocardia farcinica]PFW99444.1 hypothetical protein CJ469_05364 [Nocardia farcinica]PFX06855.1 hypothetical protein CJ468_04255 [Nocardia farcinica]CRY84529.1 Uncharacterised protein [Nocardia farcinica]SIT32773.1 hypothetical protein SAMN05421776_11397 [Nocardia farcinica]